MAINNSTSDVYFVVTKQGFLAMHDTKYGVSFQVRIIVTAFY